MSDGQGPSSTFVVHIWPVIIDPILGKNKNDDYNKNKNKNIERDVYDNISNDTTG